MASWQTAAVAAAAAAATASGGGGQLESPRHVLKCLFGVDACDVVAAATAARSASDAVKLSTGQTVAEPSVLDKIGCLRLQPLQILQTK